MNATAEKDPPRQARPDKGEMMRRAGCGLIGGMFLGLIVTLAILRWRLADPTPALTRERLEAARKQWEERGPMDYDIEISVEGPQPGKYRVQVRGGQAVAAFRNDHPLTQVRIFGTWSVLGMFSTISRDLEQVERRRGGKQDRSTPNLTLRADFDPEFGYPRRYVRMESGSTLDVSWEVTKFEPAER